MTPGSCALFHKFLIMQTLAVIPCNPSYAARQLPESMRVPIHVDSEMLSEELMCLSVYHAAQIASHRLRVWSTHETIRR